MCLVEPLLVPPQSPVKRVPWHSRGVSGAAPYPPRPARGSGIAPGTGTGRLRPGSPRGRRCWDCSHRATRNLAKWPIAAATSVACGLSAAFCTRLAPLGCWDNTDRAHGAARCAKRALQGGPELGTPPQNRCFCDTSASSRPSWFAKPARGLNRSTTERKYTKFQPRRRRPCSPSRYR